MIYSEFRFTLDIRALTSQVSLGVKKGETGRRLRIHLTENGYPYHIPDNCYAVFTAKKPDGNKIFNDCVIQDCEIFYDLTEQTVSTTGLLPCAINLYGVEGELLISATFQMIVYSAPVDQSDIESTSEYKALATLIAEAQALKDDMEEGGTGGYYLPEVEQVDDTTLRISFTPSSEEMPAVDPVEVKLPEYSGNDSTQNGIYILSDGETLEDVPDDADLVIDPNGEADEETVTGDYIPVPTTAEVGQTIVVKEVDESGKPTAWEAVDMAGGADDKWELIAEATIDEWVSIITIDKDSEGNTFSLKKMVVALTLPVCTLEDGTTTNTGYTHYQINKQGTWQGPSVGWENAQFWFEIELVSNWLTVRCYKSSSTYNSSLWNAFNLALSEAVDSNALTSFTYKNFNTTCGYDGCSYKVYGVRA